MIYNFDTTYTELDSALFQYIEIPQIENPETVLLNSKLFKELGLTPCSNHLAKELLHISNTTHPFAQAYAGHQFGFFTNLGDGRAMILGEHLTPSFERFDIQLKGSGRTLYSRAGDGKATMSSMLREYIYSYALKNLGISTSQGLAVVSTNQEVIRETIHDGAILFRVMQSHIRFGTFEYVSRFCSEEVTREFTDYVIDRHYPQLSHQNDKYLHFFKAVMEKTIQMVVDWYRVGFVHGVMNTDNMSIVGETFDYGPCAFMNRYDRSTTFSQIDTHQRYAFGNQKKILQWNLAVFAGTLLPLIDSDRERAIKKVTHELKEFEGKFDTSFYSMMHLKIGSTAPTLDQALIDKLLTFMEQAGLDYTNTFIELMCEGSFVDKVYQSKPFIDLKSEIKKVGLNVELMEKHNPQRILRNHMLEKALDEYTNHNKLTLIEDLLDALDSPYTQNSQYNKYQEPPDAEYDKKYSTHCNT